MYDKAIIEASDFVVDIGPNAGEKGGYIVYKGEQKDWRKQREKTWLGQNGEAGLDHGRFGCCLLPLILKGKRIIGNQLGPSERERIEEGFSVLTSKRL